jgi:hypothetical protein
MKIHGGGTDSEQVDYHAMYEGAEAIRKLRRIEAQRKAAQERRNRKLAAVKAKP